MQKKILGHFGRLFTALVILSLVAIWAIFAGISYDAYRGQWIAASLVANNITILLERDIARNIELYDLSLKAVVKGLDDPKIMALPEDLRRAVLFDSSAMASGLGSILVIDPKGAITMDSRSDHPSAVNLADRDYFSVHRDEQTKDELFVSHPFQSRIYAQEWSIGLSRRVNNADGSFAGVVVGTVRLSYILSLFRDVRLPPDSSVTLFDRRGNVIVRSPFDAAVIGQEAGSATEFKRQGTWSGEFTRDSSFDGIRRLFVYRQVGSLPIVQSVGLSVDRFLGELQARVAGLAVAFLLLSGLIVVLGTSLRKELRNRTAAEVALGQLAATDALTEVANRRRFDEVLIIEWRRSVRSEADLSLLMIDCDLFKAFNDANGHLGGDAALRAVAGAIKASISRPGDLAARYGGEEFAVLLPTTGLSGATVVAEAIRTRVLALNIPHLKSPFHRVTVSIGVACRHPGGDDEPRMLIEAADRALYAAKAQGRNVVALADAPSGLSSGTDPHRRRSGAATA
ncbi:sensor domain-containing diguanylate cyclase [Beijerinckia sp. L45]|uniref:sensor domain-containing diguanylate cyclase n=1 Tax=Beijerinckia sp. L45 TaxID=1641855 RepID=UPI00131B232B|nr:sensor domain-containing diguanylate cyclase [Beijerinckia sp. L45]